MQTRLPLRGMNGLRVRQAGEWLVAAFPTLALPVLLAIAATVRAFYVLRSDFALNDGGMFYVMARDIQDASFALPSFTSYNDGSIPFVYPPIGLYAAALLDTLTPASLTDAFRLLPLAGALFAVWACWRLGLAVFGDRRVAFAGTLAFALVPRSFAWLIMGGGLPRGFALGFGLLAITEAYRLAFDERHGQASTRMRVLRMGLFAGLTALTHLETAAFVALTCVILLAMRPRRILEYATAGALATAVAAPWGVLVLARHGIDPFVASLDHGGRVLDDASFSLAWVSTVVRDPIATGEPYFPIIGALGLVGAYISIARGQWFLPLWWLVTFVVAMRAYPTFVSVPTGLLAGMVLVLVIVPFLRERWAPNALRPRLTVVLAAVVAGWVVLGGAFATEEGQARYLRGLDSADRNAMAWADEETDADAVFAVVPVQAWYSDYPSEWFPALAERESIATPQGYEWIDGAFADRESIHQRLGACGDQSFVCLRVALRDTEFTHIYVPSPCCEPLKASLKSAEQYDVVYNRGGALVVVVASEEATESAD